MEKRVTRDDVARLAGVSTAVVSYVINNGPRPVSESARQRVIRAIQETGYTPNRAAQTLAYGYSKSIGLLIPNATNPFLAELTQEIGAYAFQSSNTLILGDSADDVKRERELVQHFLSQQLAGFVWYTVDQPAPVELLGEHPPRTIILNASVGMRERSRVSLITVNEKKQGHMATRHLIDQGCRNIGMIAGPEHRLNTQARRAGWKTALEEARLPATNIVYADFSEQSGVEALPRLMHCDGIIAANERQAVGALSAAYQRGILIPDDLKIVAINGTKAASYTIPSLTTVDQDVGFLAAQTMKLLDGQSAHSDDVPILLSVRQSTRR